ncbi:MAG TPA: hypothetical protein VIW67_20370 [Terriglobales bacterium]|jgi:hypothetical protein
MTKNTSIGSIWLESDAEAGLVDLTSAARADLGGRMIGGMSAAVADTAEAPLAAPGQQICLPDRLLSYYLSH